MDLTTEVAPTDAILARRDAIRRRPNPEGGMSMAAISVLDIARTPRPSGLHA
jgi:hypothetical protein